MGNMSDPAQSNMPDVAIFLNSAMNLHKAI